MKVYNKKLSGNISKIEIGYFDLYNDFEARETFRKILLRLFNPGDIIYFFFRREETLTEESELITFRRRVAEKLELGVNYEYLRKLDDKRFDSVAWIEFDQSTPNLIIDFWKYFYACDFFIPKDGLTFKGYINYLKQNGVDDIDGYLHLINLNLDFLCIKGLGADYLVITYNERFEIATLVPRSQ